MMSSCMSPTLISSSTHNVNKTTSAQLRKIKKPLIERRRRERINECLIQLKTLVLEAMNKDESRYSKMEKADILEMTVSHLKSLQKRFSHTPTSNLHIQNYLPENPIKCDPVYRIEPKKIPQEVISNYLVPGSQRDDQIMRLAFPEDHRRNQKPLPGSFNTNSNSPNRCLNSGAVLQNSFTHLESQRISEENQNRSDYRTSPIHSANLTLISPQKTAALVTQEVNIQSPVSSISGHIRSPTILRSNCSNMMLLNTLQLASGISYQQRDAVKVKYSINPGVEIYEDIWQRSHNGFCLDKNDVWRPW